MLTHLGSVVKMISKCAVTSVLALSLFALISGEEVGKVNLSLMKCYEADQHVGFSAGTYVTDRDRWPWLVALFIKDEQRFICAGSLVSLTHILTAAHCLQPKMTPQPMNTDNLIVYLGKYKLMDMNETGAVAVNASKFYIHNDWDAQNRISFDADIAVVRLETKIAQSSVISPVCLWTSEEEANDGGFVVGWGGKKDFGDFSFVSRATDMAFKANCSQNEKLKNFISSRTFCASGVVTSPCEGDSGSGFFTARGTTPYVRGIVSVTTLDHDLTCDLKGSALFTRIDEFVPWIHEKLSSDASLQCEYKLLNDTLWVNKTRGLNKTPDYWCIAQNFNVFYSSVILLDARGNHSESMSNVQVKTFKIENQTTMYLPLNVGKAFPNLQRYAVVSSNLRVIGRKFFAGLSKLAYLTLRNNAFAVVPKETFNDLIHLEGLSLVGNQIEVIEANNFVKNTELGAINLQNNKIKVLDGLLLRGNRKLEVFNVENNSLTKIGKDLLIFSPTIYYANFLNNTCINAHMPDLSKGQLRELFENQCQKAASVKMDSPEPKG